MVTSPDAQRRRGGGPARAHSAGRQPGSRPMNPSSRVCGSASAGTGTAVPNWPDYRIASAIATMPASCSSQAAGSSRSSWPVARARSQVCMNTSVV